MSVFTKFRDTRRAIKAAGEEDSIKSQLRKRKVTWLYIGAGYELLFRRILGLKRENLTAEQQCEAFEQAIAEQGLIKSQLDQLRDIKLRSSRNTMVLGVITACVSIYFAFAGEIVAMTGWFLATIIAAVTAIKAKNDAWCIQHRRAATMLDIAKEEERLSKGH